MTRAELLLALEALARRAEDAACFDEAGAAALHPHYTRLAAERPATPEAHARLLELDPLVNGAARDAAVQREAALILRAAIKMLNEGG